MMASVLPLSHHRLSVDQFHEMGRAGILPSEAHVELIDGELIDMAPIGAQHARVVNTLAMLFARAASDVYVSTQNAIELRPDSAPQPDIVLLPAAAHRYWDVLPGAADVLLLVEVSDATLPYDRKVKVPLYARHAIRETWIVNLMDRRLEVYRDPSEAAYRVRLEIASRDVLAPQALPGLRVDLSQVFPP